MVSYLISRNLNTVRAISKDHNHPIDRHVLMAKIATRGVFHEKNASLIQKIMGKWQQCVFEVKLR